MKGLFSPRRGNGAPTNPSPAPAPKKDAQTPQISPLEKRLQDMGPLRGDGSDKFFGMENYGNTCYCNSILQCLYYSVPFREAVINYPQRTPVERLEAALASNFTYQNPNAHLEAEALAAKQKATASASSARQAGVAPNQPQKPEDKDSPEYKKKVALQTLPLMDTKSNADSYGMSESLFTSLKDIFESLVASQSRIGVVRPQQFLDVLRREHEMFRTAMHQDAHEFLNLLLNEVVSNVEAEATKQSFGEKAITPPPSESAESLGTVTNSSGSKSPNTTRWVHELFEGTLTSETKCLTCEKVSQRDEVFLDLSVDLEQHSSVTACLRKFSAEEMLCERNKFHCDNCGGLQEAEKRMKIKRLPRVLALHLKRFKYTEDLQRLQKLFHRVVYPYHLRLFNTTDDAEDPDRLYELYAVVVHIGGGPYHGHYVAIIKTEDRGWLLFDDELVEPVDKNYVRNFFGDKPGLACAYVLFYQETTMEAVMREQAQEDAATGAAAAAAAAAATETGDLGKTNGYLASPNNLMQVHSASYVPSEEPHRFFPISKTTTAPQLEPHYEQAESDAPLPSPPPSQQHHHHTLPTLPQAQTPLAPVPDERAPILSAKKSDVQSKKERAREEKERRAAEKEREKNEKARRKEMLFQHQLDAKREAEELRRAIEASKADAPADQGENGSPRKSSSFNFLRRSSRSLSHRLSKDKESRGSISDLAPLTVPETPIKEEAVTTDSESFSPRDPFSPKDGSYLSHSSLAPNGTMAPPTIKEVKEIRNGKSGHSHRWRSLSFRKAS
ncbi:ubiquitin carboxyl-terminal hydrolase creB [Penicillium diatomitis]|uniref:Ubiquitin carboxyl-terminal hydrolase n=1 Tax=Penicillium diatomitis TaxID=2819901 RepID=A0A9X0BT56_9EURO|nr:ubiquitin carboxyl-terminal hydrolase creB [Penicillium diatomitis]KAJ5482799.1 ubiquitin carboxyl-terminal hydrolase creB [Penicillium diatomitis]